MAENTLISWAHDTFNPWEGCTRISPACDFCYAAERAHRFGNDHLWAGNLRRTSPANWRKPLAWNREAAASGKPRRVFCASLADVFDNQAPQAWRDDLWALIEATPHLTWMLLTKRPQNIVKMLPWRWIEQIGVEPKNIWIGITAEDQLRLDQRYAALGEVHALFDWLLFLSAEPLLGPLRIDRINEYVDQVDGGHPGGDDRFDACLTWSNGLTGELWGVDRLPNGTEHHRPELGGRGEPKFGLVIAGGESGPNARPSHPDWFRALRDQCAEAGVSFHFKQWGEWAPGPGPLAMVGDPPGSWRKIESVKVGRKTYRGADIHQFGDGTVVIRLGKKTAGRQLDGVTHDEMPA